MTDMELPHAEALLAIARQTLLDDIVPALSGDARFKALMVANAMAIAMAATRHGAIPELADAAGLAARIRDGSLDDDPVVADALLAHATARCRISAPKAK